MAYEIINIPLSSGSKIFNADDLNKFCANKKIIERKIEFFQQDGTAYWSVFIEYDTILESPGREAAGLTESGRVCYEELRRWRKETAEKEGIPPFVIAKNAHLVEIVNKEIVTLEALKQINGFGKKKLEKYGKEITGIIEAFFKERNNIHDR
jgi:superfamily II DNA helicase RecQ